ncbi:MAG: hypothetical protein H0W03_00685 [Solirubrobacterales bacterium]|nr:hypothetical protein [Solirubrobacterales bacterium]
MTGTDDDFQDRHPEDLEFEFQQGGDSGTGRDQTINNPRHVPADTDATPCCAPPIEAATKPGGSRWAPPEAPDQEHPESGQASDAVLLEALGSDMTYEEAGRAAGVSSRTVARRLDDPAFAAAVNSRRRELAEETISHIRRLRARRIRAAIDAQEVLLDLLHHDDPKVQLAAARQLHTSRAAQHDIDLHERLLALEGRLEPMGQPRPPEGWTL